jgi:hypothetical protein
MPGHGTIITSTQGQDDCSIYVDYNEGSGYYDTGTQDAVNKTGGTVNQGDVVDVDWSSKKNELQITRVGTQATGDVNSAGTVFNVSDGGDTALSGMVNISSTHGENEGWGGGQDVRCGNVNGEAAYLSE